MKALPLWFTLAALASAGEDPGQTAVRYLEQVRADRVNLEPGKDTALSPVTGTDKRAEIAGRLQRLAKEFGPEPFAAGTVKRDGDLAAVLVRQEPPLDPSGLRVEAIALVRQPDGGWLPAPVPGSFENTALGYDADRSRRQAGLARWMREEQPRETETLRAGAKERLRRKIAEAIPPSELRDRTPGELTRRLLDACRGGDPFALLGLVGGAGAALPADWAERVASVERLFAPDPSPSQLRRLLIAPEIARAIVEEKDASVAVACLDPGDPTRPSAPRIAIVRLPFARDAEGLRRVEWPVAQLALPPKSELPHASGDEALLALVPAAFRRDIPATPQATARAAADALADAYHSIHPAPPLALLDLSGDPAIARDGCLRLARLWRELHQAAASPRLLLPLAFHEENDAAVAVYQALRPQDPDAIDLQRLYFTRSATGWLLAAGMKPDSPTPPLQAVRAWADAQTPDLAREWRGIALGASVALDSATFGEPPSEAAARELFARWRTALRSGTVTDALARTAYLKTPPGDIPQAGRTGATGLLARLGEEWIAARKGKAAPPTVIGVVRHGRWTGISARLGDTGASEGRYPLYPIVGTPAGPRLVGEIDLMAGGDRTREFLNEATFGRFALSGHEAAVAELRQLYALHRQAAEADRAKKP